MSFTIAQIAQAIGAKAEGDLGLVVSGAAEPATAGPGDLAMAMSPVYAAALALGQADAAVLAEGEAWQVYGLKAAIFVPRPRYAMAGITAMMDPGFPHPDGIHPTASIDPSAQVGDEARIGPFAVVGPNVTLGRGARVGAHVSISNGARVGDSALIHDGVRIGARVQIGDRFVAQPNAVIGGDGFSFVTPEPDAVEAIRGSLGDREGRQQQAYARIHSLGAVEIGDDVEVGSGACIDRGTIADTVIGRGTKIDNLVQVGHNVRVGEDCLLCGQTGIAGSTTLGNRCVMGGQVGITDHLMIGDDVIAGAGTLLRTNQPKGRVMLGNPALPMQASVEAYKGLRRLPRLFADVASLKKRLSNQSSND